ncbi:MAG: GDP-L-fucose synthase [Thermodesulfobacteriota bacterium]|jgi:GDP-L-fucose synthase|nr:MAG: GDP-L-fucose synthase [Thermodesulfobacteriota bacterium]
MKKTSRIYIAGHKGLVGSALLRKLQAEGYTNLITRTHEALNLERQGDVETFFKVEAPEYVFLAAAKVGGILANSAFPAEFIYKNLTIQAHVIHSSYLYGVKKLLFLGSSCIYPKQCPQPIKEDYLLSGFLEPTNEPYAIAKIAGIKMCQSYNRQYGTNFISVMPTNLFGPQDNFDLETSHVLPAFIRKFHLAKLAAANRIEALKQDELSFGTIPVDIKTSLGLTRKTSMQGTPAKPTVVLWGSGTPRREFLHVDDLADACLFLMNNYDEREIINIGIGKDFTIRELAETTARIVGFQGEVLWDASKPDGTLQKLLDVSRLNRLGWKAKISLEQGIATTYRWYTEAL